ncbi:glycoside hydrolase family 13 protein [Alteribacillus bidgolensis]|uniref:Oligo-1,6-glucosidase/alpha-glucosidase n=1 Tax=Alteribacillus bidgolensis TaxID=930129 RepID=A0A1G8KX53_9BACI|nr:alpha-glucosidase [Alteribacillus bidgolensis]SDI47962.1 oligo-1,6-glucosidase/alpha-glucosidase [Alteribacillus bidgolensis]
MYSKWWHQSVVYQIYPRSFYDSNNDGVGDLRGVIEKLDYFKELGIDVIWLSPVYKSPMDDNGYDISDYKGIAEQFGSMEDMDVLIQEADKIGIKIVMDLVINHTSDEHAWFMESKSSRENPKRDWYIWRDGKENGEPPNNLRSIFGGACWEYDETTQQYFFHSFSKRQPDLNWENPDVRNELYKMVNWWLDKGIGGFRVDAITFIKKPDEFKDLPADAYDGRVLVKPNHPGIGKYLSELNQETFSKYDIFTVAEAPGVTLDELPTFVGEDGYFDMLIQFDHVDLDLGEEGKWYKPKKWDLIDFKKAISNNQKAIQDNGWTALYLENHDQPRSIDRFIPEEDRGPAAGKMLATLYFFLKGTPFIYQGQEIGMTNVKYSSISEYDDIASIDQYQSALEEGYTEQEALSYIHKRSRDNSRTPMQWNDQINGGFTKGEPWLKTNSNYSFVNVNNNLKDTQSLFYYYKKLINLRKNSSYADIFTYGEFKEVMEEHPQVFAYTRTLQDKEVLVVASFSNEEVSIPLEKEARGVIISNYEDSTENLRSFILRPYESVVYDIK